jgi:hypothetical protein
MRRLTSLSKLYKHYGPSKTMEKDTNIFKHYPKHLDCCWFSSETFYETLPGGVHSCTLHTHCKVNHFQPEQAEPPTPMSYSLHPLSSFCTVQLYQGVTKRCRLHCKVPFRNL